MFVMFQCIHLLELEAVVGMSLVDPQFLITNVHHIDKPAKGEYQEVSMNNFILITSAQDIWIINTESAVTGV